MARKKKFRKKSFFIILFLLLLGCGIYFYYKILPVITYVEPTYDTYLGSINYKVKLYDIDFNEITDIVRGTKATLYEKEVQQVDDKGTKTKDDDTYTTYRRIQIDDNIYLVDPSNIVSDYNDVVYEKEKYVRTSVTVYEDSTNPDILGFIPKGTKVEIVGFDKINDDGSIDMYQINYNDTTGFIYSKYLVDTLDESLENYNENGEYDNNKDKKYSYELYGGSAANLDYYPYEKVEFNDNKFVDNAKAYYLVGTYYVLAEVDKYIDLALEAGADAFVIDIKDGALAYKSEVAKEYSITSYNSAMNSIEFYKEAIKKIQDAGFYTIGRIVLFNDSQYAKDHPEDCIAKTSGVSTSWVSAYSRQAWEYNVKLALEAIELFDFNEIQFDYVRFPERSYDWSKWNYNFRNTYNEEKAQAIQNFLFYATDQIHKTNTYISVDVFGESSWGYVTAYGQYWGAISNIVDVISGMPYTDHFDRNNSDYWKKPYNTLYNWGLTAAARQKEIATPAKVRTWITAYNTPYWNVTTIYGANEVYAQVKGLVDAGLGSGFITWNSASSYSKYSSIADAFKREY